MYTPEFESIYEKCKDFTMTSKERCFALYNAVRYIILNNIKGDFIECGVFKGGSAMVMAYTLKELNVSDRVIYLCDTFEGMTAPTEHDKDCAGTPASELLAKEKPNNWNIWCYAPIEEVKQNIERTGYFKTEYIIGDVCETLPKLVGNYIFSLIRLDTDFYESTKVEMEELYLRLNRNGILIVDDYGHWQGSKKAVDEYFEGHNVRLMINRIDYTGILIQKI